jgi:hypothetical protein
LKLRIQSDEFKLKLPLLGGLDAKRKKPKYGKIIDKEGNTIKILVGPGRNPDPADAFKLDVSNYEGKLTFLKNWDFYPKLLVNSDLYAHECYVLAFAAISLFFTNTYVKMYP